MVDRVYTGIDVPGREEGSHAAVTDVNGYA